MAATLPTMSNLPSMQAFDDVFVSKGGHKAYLDQLLGMERLASTSAPAPAPAPAPASQNVDLKDVKSMKSAAAQYGWADPTVFSLDMLDKPARESSGTWDAPGELTNTGTTRFKEEYAKQRGMGQGQNVANVVNVNYDNDSPSGYRVLAGQVPGQQTHLYYNYDKDGKFVNADVVRASKWYEDIAPIVSILSMPFTMGGGAAALGGLASNALNLGLGTAGQAVLGGSLVGAGTAALTGQNPIKGAATGALTSAVGAYNPAGAAGITNPTMATLANRAIGSTAAAALNGRDPRDALASSAGSSVIPLMRTLTQGR